MFPDLKHFDIIVVKQLEKFLPCALQSARDVYYRFTLHYKKENLVVEGNLGDFLFVIQTINGKTVVPEFNSVNGIYNLYLALNHAATMYYARDYSTNAAYLNIVE